MTTRPTLRTPLLDATAARKFLLHGAPASGKTPLLGSWVARSSNTARKKAVYVGCDRKEQDLMGILPEHRDLLITPDYFGAADPYTFIREVLEYDWRIDGADSILIDTGTNLARDYLSAALNGGAYNSKAVTFGTSVLKMADKPHYGLAHNLFTRTVNLIKACPLNVILAMWSDYQEADGVHGAFGGPVTVNMTYSRDIAGEFGNIIYTRTGFESGRTKYFAHTENLGSWVARLHGVLPNPIPVIEMKPNPVHVWEAIDKVQGSPHMPQATALSGLLP